MKILADENVDRPIAAWLAELGHDVTEMAKVAPGSTDESVVALAQREGRVLMTFDRDIGRIVRARQARLPARFTCGYQEAGRTCGRLFATPGRVWSRSRWAISWSFAMSA